MKNKYTFVAFISCFSIASTCYANSGIGSPKDFLILTSIAFFIFSSFVYLISYLLALYAKKRGVSAFSTYIAIPTIIVATPAMAIISIGAASLIMGAIIGSAITTIFFILGINRLEK